MIKVASQHFAKSIINNKHPLGKFVTLDKKYIGINNANGSACKKEFVSLEKCLDWLNGADDN